MVIRACASKVLPKTFKALLVPYSDSTRVLSCQVGFESLHALYQGKNTHAYVAYM
jgi:hypothetical protein